MPVEAVDESGSTETVSDALIDRLEVAWQDVRPLPVSLDTLVAGLVRAGLTPRRPRLRGATRLRLDLAVAVPVAHAGVVQLEGSLALSAEPAGGVHILPSTAIRANGMRILRSQIAPAPPPGFAGDNFIGPYSAAWPELLGMQLTALATAFDAVVDAVREAAGLPDPVGGRFRVRWCEVCRDRYVEDAAAAVRAFDARFTGGVARRSRVYPNRQVERVGNLVSVSWDDGVERAPVVQKIYAKAESLLRTEVMARTPEAVARLLGGPGSLVGNADCAADGDALANLLGRTVAAACPILDGLWLLSEEVEAPPADGLDLLLALAPLLRVANPEPRPEGGGSPSADTVAKARLAVQVLLQLGRFDARGVKGSTTLRKALEEMAQGPDPLLERQGPRGTLFVVRPHWVPALRALATGLGGRLEPSLTRRGGGG